MNLYETKQISNKIKTIETDAIEKTNLVKESVSKDEVNKIKTSF